MNIKRYILLRKYKKAVSKMYFSHNSEKYAARAYEISKRLFNECGTSVYCCKYYLSIGKIKIIVDGEAEFFEPMCGTNGL